MDLSSYQDPLETMMLTGRRALDLGSYERLTWQVAQAVPGKLER